MARGTGSSHRRRGALMRPRGAGCPYQLAPHQTAGGFVVYVTDAEGHLLRIIEKMVELEEASIQALAVPLADLLIATQQQLRFAMLAVAVDGPCVVFDELDEKADAALIEMLIGELGFRDLRDRLAETSSCPRARPTFAVPETKGDDIHCPR